MRKDLGKRRDFEIAKSDALNLREYIQSINLTLPPTLDKRLPKQNDKFNCYAPDQSPQMQKALEQTKRWVEKARAKQLLTAAYSGDVTAVTGFLNSGISILTRLSDHDTVFTQYHRKRTEHIAATCAVIPLEVLNLIEDYTNAKIIDCIMLSEAIVAYNKKEEYSTADTVFQTLHELMASFDGTLPEIPNYRIAYLLYANYEAFQNADQHFQFSESEVKNKLRSLLAHEKYLNAESLVQQNRFKQITPSEPSRYERALQELCAAALQKGRISAKRFSAFQNTLQYADEEIDNLASTLHASRRFGDALIIKTTHDVKFTEAVSIEIDETAYCELATNFLSLIQGDHSAGIPTKPIIQLCATLTALKNDTKHPFLDRLILMHDAVINMRNTLRNMKRFNSDFFPKNDAVLDKLSTAIDFLASHITPHATQETALTVTV